MGLVFGGAKNKACLCNKVSITIKRLGTWRSHLENYRWLNEIVLAMFMVIALVCSLENGWMTAVWVYFLLHALATATFPHWSPEGIHPNLAVQIQKNAGLILWMLTVYLPVSCCIPKRARELFIYVLAAALVVDFTFMLGSGWGVLFTWPSFETAMAALVLPFLYFNGSRMAGWAAVLLWAFILSNRGLTGIVAGVAGVMAFAVCYRHYFLALVPVSVLPLALWVHGPTSSGRVQAWRVWVLWWSSYANPWVGFGTGSAEWVLPFLPWVPDDHSVGQTMNLFHNDFLQILFDTGLIGLLSALAVAGWLLYRLRLKPRYFACAVSYLVVMCTYFPLHYSIGQVILCILISEAL